MPDTVRASHILCKHKASRNPVSRRTGERVLIDKSSSISEMKTIIERVTKDPIQFSLIAQERSDCGSFARGGDLGFFGRAEMQRSFAEVAFGLRIGEISGVVETESGIHVIIRTG